MLYVHGMGSYHPETVISNELLASLAIDSDENWILERIGIRERRSVLPQDHIVKNRNRDLASADAAALVSNCQMGTFAAQQALSRAGLTPRDISLVVGADSSPSYTTPAQACLIAHALDIEALCLDVNTGCTSFGVIIDLLARMRPEALGGYALVVCSEGLTRSVDYSDRATAAIFGDGAAAAVLSATVPSRVVITDSSAGGRPQAWEKVRIPRHGYVYQDGRAVQNFAVRRMIQSLTSLGETARAREAKRRIFVGHQANAIILGTVAENAGIANEHHWRNVERFGNTGSAGAPSVLAERWDELRDGDAVMVSLVGAGLTFTQFLLSVEPSS